MKYTSIHTYIHQDLSQCTRNVNGGVLAFYPHTMTTPEYRLAVAGVFRTRVVRDEKRSYVLIPGRAWVRLGKGRGGHFNLYWTEEVPE